VQHLNPVRLWRHIWSAVNVRQYAIHSRLVKRVRQCIGHLWRLRFYI